ncbi:MAG: polysaccharide deacetylase family protein [Thermoanaerobaculia bacterium]|nr:polysaccharide deacetylase family protein [Thermoanaerobaculia bacterium]
MSGAARRLTRALQPVVPRRRGGGHVLAYHLVGAGSGLAVDLGADAFAEQIAELAERAVPKSLADLWESRREVRDAVAVTFDDAFRNFADQAWPVLQRYRVPVTLFVPVGFVAGEAGSPFGDAWSAAPLSWDDLRGLADDPLVSLGSHSWSHVDLRRLDRATLRDDLRRSRERLEDEIGASVESFCYPRGYWSSRAEEQVRQVYSLAVVGGGRRVDATCSEPLRIPRTSLRADMPRSLSSFLDRALCVEEWLADRLRRRRRRRRR